MKAKMTRFLVVAEGSKRPSIVRDVDQEVAAKWFVYVHYTNRGVPARARRVGPTTFEVVGKDGTVINRFEITQAPKKGETTMQQIQRAQREVAKAIICAKEVSSDPLWVGWANEWLSGVDRTEEWAKRAGWFADGSDEAGWAAWAAAKAAQELAAAQAAEDGEVAKEHVKLALAESRNAIEAAKKSWEMLASDRAEEAMRAVEGSKEE